MTAGPCRSDAPRATLEIAALDLPQQHRLDDLRVRHGQGHDGILVNDGPGSTVEATVTSDGYPPVHHIFGRDADGVLAADDMLDKVERAIGVPPDTG